MCTGEQFIARKDCLVDNEYITQRALSFFYKTVGILKDQYIANHLLFQKQNTEEMFSETNPDSIFSLLTHEEVEIVYHYQSARTNSSCSAPAICVFIPHRASSI
jgi:hypothetical protein